ncbi:MAG: heme-binding protein [Candidatus Hodarchaeota archaeon]
MVLNFIFSIVCLIGILIVAWTSLSYFTTRGIEEPKYILIKKFPEFEIREYSPYIIAYTDVFSSFNGSSTSGFRILANYIFGGNLSSKKIKMTAPVIQEPTSEKIEMTAPVIQEKSDSGYQIAFIMPQKYTLSTLPQPIDSRVKIKEVKKEIRAVYTFKGWTTEKKVKSKQNNFIRLLEENNLVYKQIKLAQYDPPYTPPYMRKNELHATLNGFDSEN